MEQQKPGLFSSLSLGRASRSSKPSSETLAHPLLAASTSSLSLPTTDATATDTAPSPNPTLTHRASGSWSKNGGDPIGALPYKPRQRHGGGIGSVSSTTSIFGPSGAPSPTLQPTSAAPVATSPVTPSAVSAPPTTSTSTSTTFALPPSHSDPPAQVNDSASSTTASGALGASLTSRLQLQSLKAAAQRIGLGNGSMGMSMIDAIFDKGQLGRAKAGEGGDWGDLLRILMGGKAILLLPTTPSSSLPMTPPTLRDHVAFLSPPIPVASSSFTSKQPANETTEKEAEECKGTVQILVTLSGLVATLQGTSITVESTIPPDSPLLVALRDASTRQQALSSLRPTHTSHNGFPSFTLSGETATLPFPPPSKTPSPAIAETKEKDKLPQGKLGRMNPFASLFGGNHTSPGLSSSPSLPVPTSPSMRDATLSPERTLSPPRSRPSSPTPLSPKPSLLNIDPDQASILSDSAGEGFQVTAYTVSKPIRYGETHKALTKSVRVHVRESLARLPDKVIEKVVRLALVNTCPAAHTTSDDLLKGHKAHQTDLDSIAALDFGDPTGTGERLQDFMEGVYDDLMAQYRQEVNEGLKRKGSGNAWGRNGNQRGGKEVKEEGEKERKESERREKEEMIEREASEGTERVEALICRLLYNRLFSPLESDDSRHDEALASRIAALNMLDLSLDHLGLITHPEGEEPEGTIAKGLDDIVERIGGELQKLSGTDYLTPKEKTDVLIKAHKIVAEGLMELPDVDLRPEGEPYKPPPRAASPTPTIASTDPTVLEPPPLSTVTSRSSGSSAGGQSLGLHPESMARERSLSPGTKSDSSDPLSAVDDVEATPSAAALNPGLLSSPSVPQLVLTDPAEASQLQEAMSDSVMTITAAPLSRDPSSSSQDTTSSASAPAPDSTPAPKPPKQATSGADLILPIIIYAVVKSNPPQLASQLMYLRRYRSAICLTGEASYAIVNLTAVVEFIEHVNLVELGLGSDSDKVMSIDDLSPIGLDYLDESNADAASIASASSRLRGRVGEFAGTAAGSANKVISGVMDSSWSALRGLMGTNAGEGGEAAPGAAGAGGEPARPGMRPRQASTFSLASVTASVASIAAAAAARNRSRASSRASEQVWGGNQELVEVSSRPGSIRERESDYPSSEEKSEEESEEEEARGHRRMKSGASASSRGGGRPGVGAGKEPDKEKEGSRDRSERDDTPKQERVSLSNRLASIGVLGRLSSPSNAGDNSANGGSSPAESSVPLPNNKTSFLHNLTTTRSASTASQGHARRSSLLGGAAGTTHTDFGFVRSNSPRGSISSLPLSTTNSAIAAGHVAGETEPPIERFMNCEVGDIRLSEIGVLLRDYRRLGGIVSALQAKQTQSPQQ
ncbi:hypothetical protein IAT38_008126 [Cryptococcus sp. DSM 104549]